MTGFLGDPTKLFMKPEKPDFFLNMPGIFDSLDSSEFRFDVEALSTLTVRGFSLMTGISDFDELDDSGSSGGGPMLLGSEVVCKGGGGAGRGGGGG